MNNIIRNFPFIVDYQDIVDKAIESKRSSDGSQPLAFINIDCITCKVKLNF